MSKPMIDVIVEAFRESIRNAAEKFQLPKTMVIGVLEIIQNEMSHEETMRLTRCKHDNCASTDSVPE